MSDTARQVAEARKYLRSVSQDEQGPLEHGDTIIAALCDTADALSARLAQAPNVLPDDEVCACLDETGGRKLRLYERCERCGAFMEADDVAARLAQAEQERDEANRWRDSWHDEAKAAIATASQFERERNEAEARLREYEEALDKLVPDVRLLVTAYYSGAPDDLEAADAPASRLDAMLFDDDGAPRSVLAPKVADD